MFQRVRMQFLKFSIEGSSDCHYDGLRIYDGYGTTAPLISTLCGYVLPSDVKSTGNVVFVTFTTDGSDTSAGFTIQYSAFVPAAGN